MRDRRIFDSYAIRASARLQDSPVFVKQLFASRANVAGWGPPDWQTKRRFSILKTVGSLALCHRALAKQDARPYLRHCSKAVAHDYDADAQPPSWGRGGTAVIDMIGATSS